MELEWYLDVFVIVFLGLHCMSENKTHISVVVPVYGCARSLVELYEKLKETLGRVTNDFEIIMVNDSSPDDAWDVIREISKEDTRLKGINLSRNFGQHNAITAGLDFCKGDWIVVMDCDLQDTPGEILKLYAKAQEGFDIVFASRLIRNDSFIKKISSKLFYVVFNMLSNNKSDHTSANFGIFSKVVIENFKRFKEQNRTFPFFIDWMGFNSTTVEIEHSKRKDGESSYTVAKLINLGIDSIIAQSNKPLKISIKFGFLLALFSLLYGCWLIFKYFAYGVPIAGWTSVMVSIYFVGGLLFANLGILGLYLGRVFDEIKSRPLYIVKEYLNLK